MFVLKIKVRQDWKKYDEKNTRQDLDKVKKWLINEMNYSEDNIKIEKI